MPSARPNVAYKVWIRSADANEEALLTSSHRCRAVPTGISAHEHHAYSTANSSQILMPESLPIPYSLYRLVQTSTAVSLDAVVCQRSDKWLLCVRVRGTVDAFRNKGGKRFEERGTRLRGWRLWLLESDCRCLTYQMQCIHDVAVIASPKMPRRQYPVLALSITDVAMGCKRFDKRQSCHVLQVSEIGVITRQCLPGDT